MGESHYRSMMEALGKVPDPRKRRGVRYPWALLLVLIGAAKVRKRSPRRKSTWEVGVPRSPGDGSITQVAQRGPGVAARASEGT